MAGVALRAHYDGEKIVLDVPFDLPADASLLVTVLPQSAGQTEDEATWNRAIAANDAFSSLANPAEDTYTSEDGEPFRDVV